MIIGNGLIAKSFKNYNLDCILFASGVSSSKEKNKDNFLIVVIIVLISFL